MIPPRSVPWFYIVASLLVLSVGMVRAETLVESNVDTRVNLALRVSETEVQKWLPAPWRVDAMTAGPSKGANLLVSFAERLLTQDAEGRLRGTGTDRFVGFAVPAKHPETGESAPFVIRVFTSSPDNVPGPYRNYLHAVVHHEQTIEGNGLEPGTSTEVWGARTDAGQAIDLQLRYDRAVPSRAKTEVKPHSAVEPSFFRIYRVDQGTDVVKSTATGTDRLRLYQLRVTVPEFLPLFDGTERVVSITIQPWYVRQVFLP